MSLEIVLNELRINRGFMSQVVAWEKLPARRATYGAPIEGIDPRLLAGLKERGIGKFYNHQNEAISAIIKGENAVISTATASGKSLCYSVPVLNHLLEDATARAIYLFPTKALAHDQLAETKALIDEVNLPINVNSYDGDTPDSKRLTIRNSDGILISNPDMLHAGILPQHTKWRSLFSSLHFVVLDEIHIFPVIQNRYLFISEMSFSCRSYRGYNCLILALQWKRFGLTEKIVLFFVKIW